MDMIYYDDLYTTAVEFYEGEGGKGLTDGDLSNIKHDLSKLSKSGDDIDSIERLKFEAIVSILQLFGKRKILNAYSFGKKLSEVLVCVDAEFGQTAENSIGDR